MTFSVQQMPESEARHLSRFRADWEGLESKLESNGSQPDKLLALRRSAWEEFERIGFPVHRKGNELWKYTDLRGVDSQEFAHGSPSVPVSANGLAMLVPRSDSWVNLVFIDGAFSEDLSDDVEGYDGFKLATLNRVGGSVLAGTLDKIGEVADFRNDAFVSLNTAFLTDGILVSVNSGRELDRPISIVFVTTDQTDESRVVYPRVFFEGREGSAATLIESHVTWEEPNYLVATSGETSFDSEESLSELRLKLAQEGSRYLTAPVVEISLASDAALTHYRLQLDDESSYHFSTTRVSQDDGSAYSSVAFALGPDIGRNDVHTILEGENVKCTLHGLYVTNNRQHQLHEVSTSHNKPHGTSRQYYKGILAGQSKAVFSGKITVARGAQKTDAQQKDLNLLLSHGAEVDTKPSLEIYADDVKCAHGATAGHINEDSLFYLQSRGIDYDTAQAMLIRGFAAEILDKFDQPDLHDFLNRTMDRLMPELQASSDTIGTT